jgi:serpin B
MTAHYGGAFEITDFTRPDAAAARINGWVEEQTNRRITNLVPAGALHSTTRLVLVNAVYFNVPWQELFTKSLTTEQPFTVSPGMQKTVPLMFKQKRMRYAKKSGFQMAALPYSGGRLQFTVIVPDKVDGLAAIEKSLTPALLGECANMPAAEVRLSLPRFRMEPPAMELSESLKALGMRRAFGAEAEFGGMAAEPLYISQVFHRTFIAVDENGTEAAAATAGVVRSKNGHPHEVPHKVVKADHPFFFAIQDAASGACIFMCRVCDPAPDKAALQANPPPGGIRAAF